jgi:hypothetical protein
MDMNMNTGMDMNMNTGMDMNTGMGMNSMNSVVPGSFVSGYPVQLSRG